ncbi:RNA polymerase sigma factor [Robiginitalea sp. IMCC43444]|uniref:RNA polymerase sigma factor n=1 Tax=Robiginitalea sp. IMCC43444 TaxID=3459121 RepID=UPI004042EBCF
MKKISKVVDGLLVLQYRAGDKRALDLLIRRYHKKLCRHAYRYTKDKDTARDVVQESWKRAINGISKLREPNTFGSWIMTIVTRKALDYLAKKGKERQRLKEFHFLEKQPADTENNYGPEIIISLRRAIESLKTDHQVVLKLFYTESYSLNEISEITGVSVGTVKSRLFHAREKLKTILNTKR